jgi:hypothetical protein
VDDGGTVFLVILSSNPGGWEGAKGSKSWSTLPDGEFAIGWSDNTDLSTSGSKFGDFLLETISETFVHGGTTREDNVLAKILSDINIGGLDWSIWESVKWLATLTVELWLEEKLGALHADASRDSDHTLVGHGVVLVVLWAGLGGGKFSFIVLSDETELLLDIFDDFELGTGGEVMSLALEELLHPVSEDTTGDLHLFDGVGDWETLEDGDSVGDTITSIANETSCSTGGVKGHDGLEGNVHVLDLEGLEHHWDHLLTVLFGVAGSLSEEDTDRLLRGATELVVESVVPDLLHVFPWLNNTGSNGVLDVEDTSLLHSLVTDVLWLLTDALHGGLVLGATYHSGEDSAGSVFTSETGLNHTWTVVDNNCLLFWHLMCVVCFERSLIIND